MGKFEDAIPEAIESLEAQIKKADLGRSDINWGHECDCEYCDEEGADADPDAEQKAEEIDQQCKQLRLTIERLKRHKAIFDSHNASPSHKEI